MVKKAAKDKTPIYLQNYKSFYKGFHTIMMTFTPKTPYQRAKRWHHPILMGVIGWVSCVSYPQAHALSLSDVFETAANTGNDNIATKKPLPAAQAFQVTPLLQQNKLTVQVTVKDGYYVYQNKFKLELPAGVTASPLQFSEAPSYVNDPDFGRVAVFEQPVTVTTVLSSSTAITAQTGTIKWQGCAKAGLCYPPEKTIFSIAQLSPTNLPPTQKPKSSIAAKPAIVASLPPTVTTQPEPANVPPAKAEQNSEATSTTFVQQAAPSVASSTQSLASVVASSAAAASSPAAVIAASVADSAPSLAAEPMIAAPSQATQDPFGLNDHLGLALLLLFLAGLGLAFMPCVLPMLPIVANIVARQHNPSAKKGLMLTGSYGLGVSTSYGVLGALIAVFGQSLGVLNWLQNPAVLLTFAGLFIVLGLYMMDVLAIRLPLSWQIKLQRLGQVGENRLGSLSGSYLAGFFSALVVSPCISAPLAGALAGVAAIGNPVIGFFALFVMGLGLSTPLIILGATQGNFMPKAGDWMNWVKMGFSLLLFAVALLLIERVLLSTWMLALWALWFAVVAVWAWGWQGKGQLLSKAVAAVLMLWCACLVVGMASGSQDSWQPLNQLTKSSPSAQASLASTAAPSTMIKVSSLAQLSPLLTQYPQVLVDVSADWCIECRIMDKNLFAAPPAALSNWQVIKLDVTDNNADSKAIYETLKVFGPPVLLYYQNGQLAARQNGEVKRPQFEQTLSQLNQSSITTVR